MRVCFSMHQPKQPPPRPTPQFGALQGVLFQMTTVGIKRPERVASLSNTTGAMQAYHGSPLCLLLRGVFSHWASLSLLLQAEVRQYKMKSVDKRWNSQGLSCSSGKARPADFLSPSPRLELQSPSKDCPFRAFPWAWETGRKIPWKTKAVVDTKGKEH